MPSLKSRHQNTCGDTKVTLAKSNIYNNGTQAAIKAGLSERSATSIANENLTKPDIQKYIQDKTAPNFLQEGIVARDKKFQHR